MIFSLNKIKYLKIVKWVVKMKISTKGRYALEAILDLAVNSPNEYESVRNVAERRNISENYLEQIFSGLRKKGIVESIRGKQGGYRLARHAEDITAGEVIRALEGSLAPVACVSGGECKQKCDRYDLCVTNILWQKMMNEINTAVDSVTIKDLVEYCTKLETQNDIEYYI